MLQRLVFAIVVLAVLLSAYAVEALKPELR